MKNLIYLIAGLIVGGLAVYFLFPKTIKEAKFLAPYASSSIRLFSIGSISSPSTKISIDSARTLDSQYVHHNPIIFSYHDLARNYFQNQPLNGFSVDVSALNSILKQSSTPNATDFPARVFLLLGVRYDTVTKNPLVVDTLTTTIVVGLKQVVTLNTTTQKNDTTYKYLPNDVWDYSNPCPPYCPGN